MTILNPSLQVQLVHDWLTGMRGGEKVLEVLCERFPRAGIHTLLAVPGSVGETIASRRVTTSLLQHLPFARTKYRYYLPLFPLFAETTKVRHADLVISSSHAVAKAMVKKDQHGQPFHICYIHTPMRYVWDRFDDYFGPERVGALFSRALFYPVARMLQAYDSFTSRRVDVFIANSRFVADRVKRFYGRDAEILSPPVDVDRFGKVKRDAQDWYLMVTALVPYKRADAAVRACARLKRRLKIIGTGPEGRRIKALAAELNAEVEFLGFQPNDKLAEYYGQAKGLLFPGVEDFGIVPVEAIAAGCPVVALADGGVLDSMTEETAVLYPDGGGDSLCEAIETFEGRRFDEVKLRARASLFCQEQFIKGLEAIIGKYRADLLA